MSYSFYLLHKNLQRFQRSQFLLNERESVLTVFNYEVVVAEFLNFDKVQLHFGTNCLSVEVNTCTDLIKMSSSAIDVVDSDIIVVVVDIAVVVMLHLLRKTDNLTKGKRYNNTFLSTVEEFLKKKQQMIKNFEAKNRKNILTSLAIKDNLKMILPG